MYGYVLYKDDYKYVKETLRLYEKGNVISLQFCWKILYFWGIKIYSETRIYLGL